MPSTLTALLCLGEFLWRRDGIQGSGCGLGNMSHYSCLPGLYLSQRTSSQMRESFLQNPKSHSSGFRPSIHLRIIEGKDRGCVFLGGLEASIWGKIGVVRSLSETSASDSLPETLSRPIIWAKPNFMIPNGKPVIIWCQGTDKAIEYHLHFEGHLYASETLNPPGMMKKVKFLIQTMTPHTAGQYRCIYRSEELWSEPSDPLDLVVTGNCPILWL